MDTTKNDTGTQPQEQKFFDIGPKNWQQAMGILEIAILDAERPGRKEAVEHVRKMAEVADLLPEAIAIIREARKLTSNVGTFTYPESGEDPNGFVFTDPLTLRIEAFLKSLPKK